MKEFDEETNQEGQPRVEFYSKVLVELLAGTEAEVRERIHDLD
jgi:hypothetical protein